MCKIAIITGINKENRVKAIQFSKKIAALIGETQTDGLGYAAFDESGSIIIEKWTKVKEAFKTRKEIEEKDIEIYPDNETKLSRLNEFINYGPQVFKIMPRWVKMGDGNLERISSIMIHGRTSTTGAKNLKNTHPFYHNDTALVHNGIIHNHAQFGKNVSDCDSESILSQYNKFNVALKPDMIESAVNPLSGYYACGIMAYDANGKPIIDVFKHNASLYACELACGLMVFSTSEMDITEACRRLKLKHSRAFKINDGIMLRLNALTGDIILKQKFAVNAVSSGYSAGGAHYKSNYDRWDEYDPYDQKLIPAYKKTSSELIAESINAAEKELTVSLTESELEDYRLLFGMNESDWTDLIASYKADFDERWEYELITDCEIQERIRKVG